MKRIISNILTLAFLLLGMTACQVETISADNDNENGGEKLTFSFKTRAQAADNTQIDSETELNEDKIETCRVQKLFCVPNKVSSEFSIKL